MARVLIIDDERAVRDSLALLLTRAGHQVLQAQNPIEAVDQVRDHATDLALLDLRLGKASGLELLPELKQLRPDMSVIVVTALAGIDTVVEAMKLGADNFVVKPIDPPRFLAVVGKGLEAGALRRTSARLDRLGRRDDPALEAGSEEMRETLQLADAVAARATTVLLLGETGTGKGVLARHIHARSPRAAAPFVGLNCAGLQRDLTESELFGFERGAFTGAAGRKLGLFEVADGGTLFLDEIGEIDAGVQARLLKVLEERRFRRLGGVAELEVDVRLIAATNRDLEAEVAAGRFRADLLYRINVFPIRIPALRERGEEILPLARRLLGELRGGADAIDGEAVALLESYAWPGNIRELRNVMERAAILCPSGPIGVDHLPPLGSPAGERRGREAREQGATLRGAESRFLAAALAEHHGNVTAAAKALGVSRATLYRKIERYQLAAAGGDGDEG